MPNKSRSNKYPRKAGFKQRKKGGGKSGSSAPSSLETVLEEEKTDPVLTPEERKEAEKTVQKELSLLERIAKARAERGIQPSPLETIVIGTESSPGTREILQDFVKNNPTLFDESTSEGAAARELYNQAVILSEAALKADPDTAKKLYGRLQFILSVVKDQQGSQSELAKKLEETIKPVQEQLKEKTTFQSFVKEQFKEFKQTLPEKLLAEIPVVGGLLSRYARSKRESKEDIEEYSGGMLEKISRGGVRGRGELDFDGAPSIRSNRGVADALKDTGAAPASSIFGAGAATGIDSLDPEKNPLGAIYQEVVAIREILQGKQSPSEKQQKKEKGAFDRIRDLYDKMFAKPKQEGGEGSGGGGEGGGSVVQDAIEDSLLKRAGQASTGLFTGLATPSMSVGAAGAGTVAAYGLAGAAIGTAAAYGINKGIDAAMGFKEGEGLADYQMQASTYNPLEFMNVSNYSTSADISTKVNEDQARGMKPVALEGIKTGLSTASDIARSVNNGVMTQEEAEAAIREAQTGESPKYDENFLPFYRDVQSSLDEAKSEGDMVPYNKKLPELMKQYGYDNETKDQRLAFRNTATAEAEAAPAIPDQSEIADGSVTTVSTDNPAGMAVEQAEAERQAMIKAQEAVSAPQAQQTTNNTAITNKSSVVTNNFNDDLRIRNNEPTVRQMQRESVMLSKT